MLALLIGAALALYGWKIHDRMVILVALGILLIGIGFIRFAQVIRSESQFPQSGHVVMEGRVAEYPDIRDTSVRVIVRPEGTREKILVSAPVGSRVSYGDTVQVSGTITIPKSFETDAGRIFNYTAYLQRQGITRQISFAELRITKSANHSLKGALFALRSAIESRIRMLVPEPESSLTLGMLLGGKSGLGDELTKVFTRAGIIHIVVLSGYNITIIAEAVRLALSRVPFYMRMFGSGTAIILFVIMAGADASAVRAGCMAVIALVARATGRPYVALRALVLTALAMALWNPLIIFYDPGFVLSVLATLGIIVLTDPISNKLTYIKWRFVREIVATSVAAYLAVLPYLAFQIGAVSVVALAVNPIVLPVVPLAMALGAVTGTLAFLNGYLALLGAFPLVLLLRAMIGIARAFSSLPFASVIVPAWSGVIIALIYIGVGARYWYRKSPDALARRGQ